MKKKQLTRAEKISLRKEKTYQNNLKGYEKTLQLSKSHQPLPELDKPMVEETNFINLNGGYFNKGKHRNKPINEVPPQYLKWVLWKVKLTASEKKLIKALL